MSSRSLNALVMILAGLLCSVAALAQPVRPPQEVHVIYMGGSDCPPCVAWRMEELPKLKATSEFAQIRFSHVEKGIRSPVPPRIFLPAEVKPLKEKLDHASSGRTGSPLVAIMVDGEVFDFFHGTRSAHDYERMLAAIRNGTEYPFKRCIKMSRQRGACEIGA